MSIDSPVYVSMWNDFLNMAYEKLEELSEGMLEGGDFRPFRHKALADLREKNKKALEMKKIIQCLESRGFQCASALRKSSEKAGSILESADSLSIYRVIVDAYASGTVFLYDLIDGFNRAEQSGDFGEFIEKNLAPLFEEKRPQWEKSARRAETCLLEIKESLSMVEREWEKISGSDRARSFLSAKEAFISEAEAVCKEVRSLYHEEVVPLGDCVWGNDAVQMKKIFDKAYRLLYSAKEYDLAWACGYSPGAGIDDSIGLVTERIKRDHRKVGLLGATARSLKSGVVSKIGSELYGAWLQNVKDKNE